MQLRRRQMIGQVVGGYTIAEVLRASGRSEIYLAEHRRIHRRAAVKLLRPAPGADEPGAVDRFFDEMRKLAALVHPGIVEIYDADVHDGRVYLVMELLDGESLAAIIARAGNLASETTTAAALGLQVADALAAAHVRGIAHGDLGVDDVFVDVARGTEGPVVAKVLNFGVSGLLRPGAARADRPSDIHAFGCLLFQMLTGQAPFSADDGAAGLDARARCVPPAPSTIQPGVSAELDELVADLLAADPHQRPSSMVAVGARLARAMGDARPLLSRKILASGAPVVVAQAVAPAADAPPDFTIPEAAVAAPASDHAPSAPDHPAPRAIAGGTRIISRAAPEAPARARAPRETAVIAPRVRSFPPPRRAPRWLWAGLAAGAALILAVAGLLVGSTGPGPAARRSDSPPASSPEPALAAPAPAPPIQPEPPPQRPPTVTVEIISHPEGADALVVGESAPRGKTPLRLEVPRSHTAVELRLSATGYVDRTVALDVAADHAVEISLEKAPAGDHAAAPPDPGKTRDHHRPVPKYYLLGD